MIDPFFRDLEEDAGELSWAELEARCNYGKADFMSFDQIQQTSCPGWLGWNSRGSVMEPNQFLSSPMWTCPVDTSWQNELLLRWNWGQVFQKMQLSARFRSLTDLGFWIYMNLQPRRFPFQGTHRLMTSELIWWSQRPRVACWEHPCLIQFYTWSQWYPWIHKPCPEKDHLNANVTFWFEASADDERPDGQVQGEKLNVLDCVSDNVLQFSLCCSTPASHVWTVVEAPMTESMNIGWHEEEVRKAYVFVSCAWTLAISEGSSDSCFAFTYLTQHLFTGVNCAHGSASVFFLVSFVSLRSSMSVSQSNHVQKRGSKGCLLFCPICAELSCRFGWLLYFPCNRICSGMLMIW